MISSHKTSLCFQRCSQNVTLLNCGNETHPEERTLYTFTRKQPNQDILWYLVHTKKNVFKLESSPRSWCLLIHFPTFFLMDTLDFELFHTTQFHTGASQLYLLSVFQAQIFPDIGTFLQSILLGLKSLVIGTNKCQTYMFINLYYNIRYRALFLWA